MIKMHSKKILSITVGMGMLASSVAWAEPAFNPGQGSRGEMRQQLKEKLTVNKQQNICDNISQRAGEIGQKITDQENKVKTNQEEKLANWTQKTSEVGAKLAASRSAWDANRDQQFAKLEARATTDEQKKAVADFEAAAKSAIATRRAAVDAAMKTFRESVKSAITSRQSQIDQLVSAFETARQTAFSKAQSDCGSGVNAAAVRTNLMTSIKSAKTQLQSDRQNATKIGATVKSLVQTRQQLVDKAFADFKATMEQARIALKKAFPNDSTTSDATSNTPGATVSPSIAN